MTSFSDAITAHAVERNYSNSALSLPFNDWKPRFKLLGKTFGHMEWLRVRRAWLEAGGGELTPYHLAFLEVFLTQKAEVLFKAMKQEAKPQFQAFFESAPKPRLLIRFHALELPAPQSDTWSLTLNDGTPYGPVVVIEMQGWEIQGCTLVG
jgi:hypothetical protein